MGERIQVLIEECTETLRGYDYRRGNYSESYFDKKKFAELLIRDCIDIIRRVPPGYQDYRSQIEQGMQQAIVNSLIYSYNLEDSHE